MAKIYAALVLLAFSAPVWADAELFASTEARPWQGFKALFSRQDTVKTPVRAVPADFLNTAFLATLEPSSGGEPAGGHGETTEATPATTEATPAAAEGDSHATDKLKAEKVGEGGHTSAKVADAPKGLPRVTIGGAEVMTFRDKTAHDVSASTPSELQGPMWKEMLERRFNITPYAHDPMLGSLGAPIQVIIFEDLSCGQCLPALASIDAALAKYSSQTQVVHIHTPTGRLQDTNLPAFYGKVASRMGKFWEYRAGLIAAKASTPDAVLDVLLKTGVRERDVRAMMMTESRRFYRELDADVLMARTQAVSQPPVVFVNGIRVGTGGIPLDKFAEVLSYVSSRLAYGLAEPPL